MERQGMGGSGSFEDKASTLDAELKAVLSAGADMVAVLGHVTGGASKDAVAGDSGEFAALDEIRLGLIERQRSVHDRLALVVSGIAATIEKERLNFDRREVPLRSDALIGFWSKKAMRRRIERRALMAGDIERLKTSLGRADRLAGRIATQRRNVMAQRAMAEALLDAIPRTRGGPDQMEGAGAGGVVQVATLAASVVDTLNLGVRDLTLLLHKLTFDVERLLDHYAVLLSFRRDRDAHQLMADTYPYFGDAVARLAKDVLPGARLADSRRGIDLAFAERFSPG
ncbi:hypothetical protein [Neorhizobium sp. NCHU2750]|uniref:hypothetical protein n=1 Tax=Neorhizobium sp. NCHU2750 TaxID=1825976 RepID=UPI000EB76B17|nr:hypothetical protein NCHU2750_23940 [Neorhizobium sp. NCHU2750]